jgi:hypothetical protein
MSAERAFRLLRRDEETLSEYFIVFERILWGGIKERDYRTNEKLGFETRID